ncbi:MAG TPA: amino acid adenylation domain-containing protein [Steroidobacteraceae bacterium]|nr:amino acid adenylation domain-containing protein [Steroidobacteraceae bacterium]
MSPPAGCRCIHELFEQRAEATPERIAVSFGRRRLSYRELNSRANRFAHLLRRHGVGPEVLVGVCLDRTPELIVALLGILKAGGCYVPIDPQYPRERMQFMLQDAQAPVLVTERAFAPDLPIAGTTVIVIEDATGQLGGQPEVNPQAGVSPENLAYVIYTSGSTGTPKGTLITHRNVVRLFAATRDWFHFGEDDVWTLFHSSAFDFSVWEMWGALLHGGRLVVVPFGITRTPSLFLQLLRDERVSVLNQTPSAFRQLVNAEEAAGGGGELALRWVIFGGEALDHASLAPWFGRHGDQTPRLVNMYGITETTVHVTYRPLSKADLRAGSVIGIPIPDLQVHLLDEDGHAVADGQTGEIHVGGAGVARGYLRRPELTAARFLPDPFSADPMARLYRSGDLARRLPDGGLEYLGRGDRQVKIRGFRIELGEIAAVLNSHAGIRDSVVVATESAGGEKILVAYLIKAGGAPPSLTQLRALLRARLPEYMVPSGFAFIDSIPLTVNGKLDVAALPPPAREEPAPMAADSPARTGAARLIADIWQEVLDVERVGLDQNFFDVGGDSISLAEVHQRLERAFDREIPIVELFSHTTVEALAEHLGRREAAPDAATSATTRAQRQREALAARRRQQHRD